MRNTKVTHPHVRTKEGIQGGKPTIKGSRLPVSTLIIHYKTGKDTDEILELYPQLKPAQVYDAISYYHDHREQMEKEIDKLQDEDHWKEKYPPGKNE